MALRKLRPPRGYRTLPPGLLAPPQSLRQIKPAPYQFALLFSVLCPMNEPPATDRVHRRCRTPAARSVSGCAQPRAKAAHRRWTTSPRRRILRGSEGYRPVTDRAGSGYRRAWRAGNSVGVVVKLYSSKFIHEFSRLCHVRQPKKHRR